MAEDRHLRSLLLGIAAGLPVGDDSRRQILLALSEVAETQPEVVAPPPPLPAPPVPEVAPPPPPPPPVPVAAPVAPPPVAPVAPGTVVLQAPPPAPIVVQSPVVAPPPPPVPVAVPPPVEVPVEVPVEPVPGSTGEGPVGPPMNPIPIQTRRAFENEFLPEMERMLESSTVEGIRQTFLDLIDTAMRTKNDYYVTLKYYQALNQTDNEFFDGLKRVIREWQT